ncbi:hypothetical protein QL285_026077 [Trifolium repens]|nr:hypothetical protein QL285_026077 [Trifolium repens]
MYTRHICLSKVRVQILKPVPYVLKFNKIIRQIMRNNGCSTQFSRHLFIYNRILKFTLHVDHDLTYISIFDFVAFRPMTI